MDNKNSPEADHCVLNDEEFSNLILNDFKGEKASDHTSMQKKVWNQLEGKLEQRRLQKHKQRRLQITSALALAACVAVAFWSWKQDDTQGIKGVSRLQPVSLSLLNESPAASGQWLPIKDPAVGTTVAFELKINAKGFVGVMREANGIYSWFKEPEEKEAGTFILESNHAYMGYRINADEKVSICVLASDSFSELSSIQLDAKLHDQLKALGQCVNL